VKADDAGKEEAAMSGASPDGHADGARAREIGSTNAELTAELMESSSPGTAIEGPIDSGLWQVVEYSDEDVADLVMAMQQVRASRAA
jgi:hypothetical protein